MVAAKPDVIDRLPAGGTKAHGRHPARVALALLYTATAVALFAADYADWLLVLAQAALLAGLLGFLLAFCIDRGSDR